LVDETEVSPRLRIRLVSVPCTLRNGSGTTSGVVWSGGLGQPVRHQVHRRFQGVHRAEEDPPVRSHAKTPQARGDGQVDQPPWLEAARQAWNPASRQHVLGVRARSWITHLGLAGGQPEAVRPCEETSENDISGSLPPHNTFAVRSGGGSGSWAPRASRRWRCWPVRPGCDLVRAGEFLNREDGLRVWRKPRFWGQTRVHEAKAGGPPIRRGDKVQLARCSRDRQTDQGSRRRSDDERFLISNPHRQQEGMDEQQTRKFSPHHPGTEQRGLAGTERGRGHMAVRRSGRQQFLRRSGSL